MGVQMSAGRWPVAGKDFDELLAFSLAKIIVASGLSWVVGSKFIGLKAPAGGINIKRMACVCIWSAARLRGRPFNFLRRLLAGV